MKRNRIVLAGIVLAVVAIIAVVMFMQTRSTSDHQRVVGVILSTSGPADFIGKPERDVLEALVAAEEVPFRLEFRDSGGNPTQAAELFRQFSNDPNVIAVIGPSTSGEALQIADAADQAEIPLLTLAASAKIVLDENGRTRNWVFKFAQNDSLAAKKLLSAMQEMGVASIALIYSADGFGKSGAEEFRLTVKDAGSPSLVYDASFDPALAQAATTIRAIPDSADGVLVWGTSPGPAVIVKALRKARPGIKIFLSHGNASHDFLSSTGIASENAVVVGSRVLIDPKYLDAKQPNTEAILQYQKLWRSNFDGPPSHFGGHARDAFEALMVCHGDSDAPPPDRTQIRDCLESTNSIEGVTGVFRFTKGDHAGLTPDAFETFVIKNQEFVPMRETE